MTGRKKKGNKGSDVLKTLSLLFVEDDIEILEQISEYLRRRVGKIYTAKDGVEGLKILEENHVDIVITDIRMPVMDGLKMASVIKEIDPDITIAVTTAYSDNEYFLKAIEVGVHKYILKPIDVDELTVFLDETARKRQALAFLRGMEKLADGVLLCNKDGRVTFINPTAERMLSLKKNDIFKVRLEPLLNCDQREMIDITCSNGQRGVGEISAAEIEWEGKLVYIVSTWDVTRHIEAQAASEAKIQFLRTMWHELLTPLNPIIGFADILMEEKNLSTEHREFAGFISTSGKELQTLINSILMLSDVTINDVMLDSLPIEVPELFRSAIQMVREAGDGRCNITSESELIAVSGDHRMIKQIVFHLLSNACKFTPEGGKIHLEASREDEYAVIKVSDTGIGIPLHLQEKIFDAFWQVQYGYERKYKGVGIGLHLAKQIVEKHRGRIWVKSVPGKGSCFYVALPLADMDEHEES